MISIKSFIAILLCILCFTSSKPIQLDSDNHIDSEMCLHYVECYELEDLTEENFQLLYTYTNVCWRCHSSINSNVNKRCNKCGWYICNKCGACDPQCSRCPAWNGNGSSSNSSSKDNSWIWFIVIGVVVVGGIYIYKRYKDR